ncbi:TPA: hypothetical protein ACOELP_002654 [Enterobacter hormaechei]
MSMIHTLPLETQTVVVTRFISDVCEHRMTVLQDSGVYLGFNRIGKDAGL